MAQKRGSSTNKAVHTYWYKQVTENTKEMVQLLGDGTFENILEGGGEHCYACGIKSHMTRCHIIPHALGGNEKTDNLFLMCAECHKNNPDTIYRDLFFRYIRKVEYHLDTLLKSIYSGLEDFKKDATQYELERYEAFIKAEPTLPELEKLLFPPLDEEEIMYTSEFGYSEATRNGLVWKTMMKVGGNVRATTS